MFYIIIKMYEKIIFCQLLFSSGWSGSACALFYEEGRNKCKINIEHLKHFFPHEHSVFQFIPQEEASLRSFVPFLMQFSPFSFPVFNKINPSKYILPVIIMVRVRKESLAPRSRVLFIYSELLYKNGQEFLNIQYI